MDLLFVECLMHDVQTDSKVTGTVAGLQAKKANAGNIHLFLTGFNLF